MMPPLSRFIAATVAFWLILASLVIASSGSGDYAEQLMNAGRFQEALAIFTQNLMTSPQDIFSMQGAAICNSNMGRVDLAAQLFEQAAGISKNHQLHYNAGVSYHNMGDYSSAMRNYNLCIAINKNMRPCHIKMASIYRDLDDPMNTQRFLINAISLEPGNPDAYSYLADTYNNLKQFQLAIDNYEKVLKIVGGNDMKTLISIGDTYTNMKAPEKAYAAFMKALKLLESAPPEQRQDMLYVNMGLFYSAIEMGYWKNYEKNSAAIIDLASSYNKKYERNRKQIEKKTKAGVGASGPGPNQMEPMQPNPLSPYRLMFLDAPPNLYRDISNQWAQQTFDSAEKLGKAGEVAIGDDSNSNNAILNIGYISRRFYNYPGTQMLIRLFPLHNRKRMKVHAFANGPDDTSNYRSFIRNNSDYFLDITNDSLVDSVEKMNAAKLDVLIDYDGIHDFNSLKLLSQLKSVVKITWLGYAGTVAGGGAGSKRANGDKIQYSIEYVVSDKNILSPDLPHTRIYKEKMIYLPYSYQPQDEYRGVNITDMHVSKQALLAQDNCTSSEDNNAIFDNLTGESIAINVDLASLSYDSYLTNRISDRKWLINHFNVYESLNKKNPKPDDKELFVEKVSSSVWLICFNRLSKITPDAFEDWLSALNHYPNSVLILMKDSAEAQAHVTRTANSHGVRSDRIIFFSRVNSLYLYRAILRSADYFLDTRHYNSHTVATDSIIERTPVITLQGTTFASRVSSSLNDASGVEYLQAMNLNSRKGLSTYLTSVLNKKPALSHKISYIIKMSIDEMLSDSNRALYNSPQFTRFMEYAASAAKDLKVISAIPSSLPAIDVSHDSSSSSSDGDINGINRSNRFHIIVSTGSPPIAI